MREEEARTSKIGGMTFTRSMLDTRASINILPKAVFDPHHVGELQPFFVDRDIQEGRSKEINCLDFQLEFLESPKNISIYTLFGRNCPIEMIDDYDGTVHRGPFRKYRDRWI